MKKTVLFLLIIGLLIGLGYAYYGFNKTHESLENQEAIATLSASELFKQFSESEEEANKKYVGKVVEVSGVVYSIEEGNQNDLNILLMEEGEMFGVSCNTEKTDKNSSLKIGDSVSIKGECSGFLSDVVLIRCVLKID